MTRIQAPLKTTPRVRLNNQTPQGVNKWARWVIVCALTLLCASVPLTVAQTLNTLFTFDSSDGSFPAAPLMQGTDGNFYGTTLTGGTHSDGTVFTMTPDGQATTLYNFCSQSRCTDGSFPNAGLVQGTDGNFYGTTSASEGWGTVFKISSSGSLAILHDFIFADGASPRGLVLASDGNFYGTTYQGGINTACWDGVQRACGTVFKITPAGAFTTLYNFCSQSDCMDGALPVAGLIQGADGNFYGTTYTGGGAVDCTGGCGTAFKITPNGTLTTLYRFCSQSGCPDGEYPTGRLVATGTDLYGTTSEGGTGAVFPNTGTIFKLAADGQLTTLYNFCSQSGCSDGGLPTGGLVQGTDGNFYGTTNDDGANGRGGTVFKINSTGQLTTLYTFCSHGVLPHVCTDSGYPNAELVQAANGNFYGTAEGRLVKRCTHSCGAVFSFGTGLELRPSSGKVGKQITIVGLNLAGATSVSFNGVAAAFVAVSQTQITATVPAGATTGTVQVTTPGGVIVSNTTFLVTPFIKSFKPARGPVGTAVTITGTSFTGTTQVTFGDVESTNFTMNSDTQVTAIVPAGAVTGKIGIASAGGTGISAGTFTVMP